MVQLVYERPRLVILSEKTLGQISPQGTCYLGTDPGGSNSYCEDGFSATSGEGLKSHCQNGNIARGHCTTGDGFYI
jgi:hypothetical protein